MILNTLEVEPEEAFESSVKQLMSCVIASVYDVTAEETFTYNLSLSNLYLWLTKKSIKYYILVPYT